MPIEQTSVGHESIAHEYWKRFYFEKLRREGYKVTIEAPRVGGRVDLLAEKDCRRIGIEIETGSSNVVENVKNCLRSRFDEVWVVVTDKRKIEGVKRKLESKDCTDLNA